MYSLSFTGFLNDAELKIFGRHRESNQEPLVYSAHTTGAVVVVALSGRSERLCAIQAVLGSIPGGDQIFLILHCLKSL